MTRLGAVITEAIVHYYGRDEYLRRLADPFWFQSFGAAMGMDWHSSGVTTSVLGALKRGLVPLSGELGLHVCGGRGAQSRKTPGELINIGDRVGLDGAVLSTMSRLVAKVDSAAVQDGFDLYLYGFVVADDGKRYMTGPDLKEIVAGEFCGSADHGGRRVFGWERDLRTSTSDDQAFVGAILSMRRAVHRSVSIFPLCSLAERTQTAAMRDEAGKVTRLISQIQNVTHHKECQRQLAERATQLELALEAIRGGFWYKEVDSQKFEASARLAQFIAGPAAARLDLESYLKRVNVDDGASAD